MCTLTAPHKTSNPLRTYNRSCVVLIDKAYITDHDYPSTSLYMLLTMHPKSVEKNITSNLIVSNQLNTIVSNFSSLKLPASSSVDSVIKTSPLMSSVHVLVTDSDPKYLRSTICISSTSTRKCTTTKVMELRVPKSM